MIKPLNNYGITGDEDFEARDKINEIINFINKQTKIKTTPKIYDAIRKREFSGGFLEVLELSEEGKVVATSISHHPQSSNIRFQFEGVEYFAPIYPKEVYHKLI